MSKPWVVKDGKPRCARCGGLLKPVDEPPGFECASCRRVYPLTDDDVGELMFDSVA